MTKTALPSSICKNCGRLGELFSGVKHNQLYSDLCERCVGNLGSSEFYRRHDRQSQRRTYAKDIVQPWEPEFVKAHPEKARQYYSDEDIRRLG